MVFLEWTHLGPQTIFGFSDQFFTISRVKEEVRQFSADFDSPTTASWSAGVVIGFESTERWEAVVLADDGEIYKFQVGGEPRRQTLGQLGTLPGRHQVTLTFEPNMARIVIDGESIDVPTSIPQVAGLALDSTEVRFENIQWF